MRQARTRLVMTTLVLLVQGCNGGSGATAWCTPGSTLKCQCPGGGQGTRECTDGQWEPCQGCVAHDAGETPSTGSPGGECYRDKTCDPGLACVANKCVKPAPDASTQDGSTPDGSELDGSTPDGSKHDGSKPDGTQPDGTQPDASKPDSVVPDLKDPCAGALFNDAMYIGDTKTVTSGSKQVQLEMTDIGTSGSAPAALIKIDGTLSILNEGDSDTSTDGFVVHVGTVQNVGTATQRWAQVCVLLP